MYYTKIIQEIDRFRSTFNGTTSNISQSISLKSLDTVFSSNEAHSLSAQESRCSAFYRMIGFPVVSPSSKTAYSPGFDPELNVNTAQRSNNLTIANELIKSLNVILQSRESYPKTSANAFNNRDDYATTLALGSVFIRPLDKQLKNGIEPLETDWQLFEVPGRETAQFNDAIQATIQSTHILKPFVVDPRIELTVTPAANRICAPFLADKSKTQLSKGQYLKRPYIEKVIRARFNPSNVLAPPQAKQEINKYANSLIALIKTNPDIKDKSLVDILGDPSKSLHNAEIMVFGKFIKILQAFMLELANSIRRIQKVQVSVNWRPVPSKIGPEFGSTLKSIDYTDKTHNKKVEVDIIDNETKKILGQTDFDIGLNDADTSNFIFSDIDDIVFATTQHNYAIYDQNLASLNAKRDDWGNRANNALRTIEILLGEFSGLGLIDVIAIQAALWIITPEALLGLIDDSAKLRMQTDKNLQTAVTAKLPIDALKEFEEKLSGIYVLIWSFYQDFLNHNGKNNQ